MDPSKQSFINAFFSAFKQKIDRLQELRKVHPDEAFTLCLVYIDRLASGHFGGKEGKNRRNFWRALAQLTGNPLFGMIHPRQLEELTQRCYPSAVSFISSVVNRQPNALLKESDVVAEIRKSSLLDSEKQELIENLWRASMANIAYDFIRVAEVHGPGSGGLSFDESVYQGRKGVTLSFQMFYAALQQIQKSVAEASLTTSHWFGKCRCRVPHFAGDMRGPEFPQIPKVKSAETWQVVEANIPPDRLGHLISDVNAQRSVPSRLVAS